MKRIVCFLIATVLLTSFFSVTVFAAEKDIVSVAVTVPAPVAGQRPEEAQENKIQIFAVNNDAVTALQAPVDFLLGQTRWKESASGTILKSTDMFVAGRSYRCEVGISFSADHWNVNGETKVTLNEEEAHIATRGTDKKQIEVVADLVCTPGDVTPKVTLTVDGAKSKEYDGKPITLTAVVEKTAGVSYRYVWYHDGTMLAGQTDESLAVKNVSDSGKYYCKVFAVLDADPERHEYSTASPAHTISITPHTITIVLEDAAKNASDPDPTFTYNVLGEIYDPLEGSPTRTEGENIGEYTIQIGTLGFAGEAAGNYQILAHQGKFTILKAGEITLYGVTDIADLSYISGQKGAKIRASASRGTIPDGGLLAFSTATDSEKDVMAAFLKTKLLKSFSVKITDADGKEAVMPNYARLRLQIPLTEEEATTLDLATIHAVLYTDECIALETKPVVTGGVTYLIVEMEKPGAIALSEGTALASESDGENPAAPRKVSPVLWVVIVLIALVAIGAIIFTVIWTKKHAPEQTKIIPDPQDEAPPEDTAPASLPNDAEDDDVKIFLTPDKASNAPATPDAPAPETATESEEEAHLISFEDLEE